jgi:O-acetyl-ADP-ribose deacetylase
LERTPVEVVINSGTIELKKGDITLQETDAIVNAANEALVLGGGVAGAIRNAGGPAIQEECRKKAPIRVGEAVITTGGKLKARHVIHAVGPRMGEGNEDAKLHAATLNSLKVADENKLKSISFPAISTGIFGYPVDRCARIMLEVSANYLNGKTGVGRIVFVLFSDGDYNVFEKALVSLNGK